MPSYKYAYLIGSLYFLAIWLALFLKWPNRRKYMLIVGGIFMWLGVFAEYFWWTVDWWHPATITGTRIGIEDFIMSFTHAGIPLLIYKFFFRKDLDRKFELDWKIIKTATLRFAPLFILSFGTTALLFYLLHIHSFVSASIGMLIAGIYILAARFDLAPTLFWSAILMIAVSLPFYALGAIIDPNIFKAFWNFPQISGYTILSVPVEDFIWYALLGFFLGGIIEYVFNYRLVDEIPSVQARSYHRPK